MIAMLSLVRIVVLRARMLFTWPVTGPDLDPVPNFDGSFREDDQSADEVARDVLQSEPDADADSARKDRQRRKIQTGALQRDKNTDDQHEVAAYLRNRVLQRAIQAAFAQKPVKEEALRDGCEPEDDRDQRNELEDLRKAQSDRRDLRLPRDRQAAKIQPEHQKADEHDQPNGCRQNRDEILVQPEAAELAPHETALQEGREKQPCRQARGEGHDTRGRDLPPKKTNDGLEEPLRIS